MEKEEQTWRGDFTDSEGDVGSLLDSIVDEDEDDSSLAAVSGDEGEEFSQFVDPTGRQQGRNSTYNSPHVVHDTTRHQRRRSTYEATPMAAPRAMPPSYVHPHAPRSDGLTFDMSQPWQRSLLKQYDLQKSQPPARRKRPDLMYVLHTDSRDHGFSWDEGSAYSMDTSNGSTLPGHPQFVHRVHHPILYEPEQAQKHSRNLPHTNDDAVSSMSETTRKEGRDDSTSRPMRPSPKTSPPRFVNTSVQQHLSPRSVMEQPRKQRNMHDTMKPYMADPAAGMAPPDPACYCLGYNMLDVLLPPQRRPLNRLSRVEEEVLGMQPPHGR